MGLSNFAENGFVANLVSGASFAGGGALHLSLHTALPDDTGTNELSATGYARQPISFGTGSTVGAYWQGTNTNAQVFSNTGGGAWTTVTHIGIWSASGGGNFISFDDIPGTDPAVPGGDGLLFAAGDIEANLIYIDSNDRHTAYMAEKEYNALWRNTIYSGETNYYIAMMNSKTVELNSSDSPGYSRSVAMSFTDGGGGLARTSTTHTFTASGGDWQEINYKGVYNASSGGDLLFIVADSALPLSILDGDTISLGSQDVRIRFT